MPLLVTKWRPLLSPDLMYRTAPNLPVASSLLPIMRFVAADALLLRNSRARCPYTPQASSPTRKPLFSCALALESLSYEPLWLPGLRSTPEPPGALTAKLASLSACHLPTGPTADVTTRRLIFSVRKKIVLTPTIWFIVTNPLSVSAELNNSNYILKTTNLSNAWVSIK